MLRSLYGRVMALAESRHAQVWLAAEAFAEGVFFPVPPDLLLMPLVLANRDRAWRYAAITTVASVCGGTVGYLVGHFLGWLALDILAATGVSQAAFTAFQHWFAQWGVLILALPIPYKLVAIASGVAGFNYPLFLGASLVIRGLRFFIVAGLLRAYGEPVRAFIERRLALVTGAVVAAVIALVLLIRFHH